MTGRAPRVSLASRTRDLRTRMWSPPMPLILPATACPPGLPATTQIIMRPPPSHGHADRGRPVPTTPRTFQDRRACAVGRKARTLQSVGCMPSVVTAGQFQEPRTLPHRTCLRTAALAAPPPHTPEMEPAATCPCHARRGHHTTLRPVARPPPKSPHTRGIHHQLGHTACSPPRGPWDIGTNRHPEEGHAHPCYVACLLLQPHSIPHMH